jgi:hypothetical protein
MWVSFRGGRHKAEASTYGVTGRHMRASGIRGGSMATECGKECRVIHISDNGRIALDTDSGRKLHRMGISTRGSGDTHLNMARGLNNIIMEIFTLGITEKDNQMVSESLYGLIRDFLKVTLSMVRNKARVSG